MHEQRWDAQAFTFDILKTLELHVLKTDDFVNMYALEEFLHSIRNVSYLVISARKELGDAFRSEDPRSSISKAWIAVFEQYNSLS